jgi:hypothetical protein
MHGSGANGPQRRGQPGRRRCPTKLHEASAPGPMTSSVRGAPCYRGRSAMMVPHRDRRREQACRASLPRYFGGHRCRGRGLVTTPIMTAARSRSKLTSRSSCTTRAPHREATRAQPVQLPATCQTSPDRPVSGTVPVSALQSNPACKLPTRHHPHSRNRCSEPISGQRGAALHHICTTTLFAFAITTRMHIAVL